MKTVKKDLQILLKNLRNITRKSEAIAKKVDKLEKQSSAKKTKRAAKPKAKAVKRKPVKKASKTTATDEVFNAIKRNRKGIDIAQLKKKTGFADTKVRNIVFRLKKQGKVKNVGKGVYTKI
jgi:hypothetical protein